MPTYDYECDGCGTIWEESFSYENRDKPVEEGCVATVPCDGNVRRIPVMPGFAYDNIASKGHPKKTPDWMTDRLKDIKKNQPKATMSIPG